MHRLAPKGGGEPQRDQIQIAIDEAVEPKLARPVLTCLVLDDLFPDPREARYLGHIGDVAVHIVVDLYALDDLTAIGLEPTVEVV